MVALKRCPDPLRWRPLLLGLVPEAEAGPMRQQLKEKHNAIPVFIDDELAELLDERALAHTRQPDQAYFLAGLDRYGQAFENLAVCVISEAHVLEFDRTLDIDIGQCARQLPDVMRRQYGGNPAIETLNKKT